MVCMYSEHYSSQILMKLEFSRQIFFLKNPQVSNFMKIRPVEFDLIHADGRTDMTKLTVAFRNFANAPKNWKRERKVSWSRHLFGTLIGRFS